MRTGDAYAEVAYDRAVHALMLVIALAACGCGRLGFDPANAPDSGGRPDDVAPDEGMVPVPYVKPAITGAGDQFGYRVALSADGTTLAVGAVGESSNAVGVGGDRADNSAASAGAVYIYVRSGGMWVPQAYVKASNTETNDAFGYAVALSADGNTLAVGAPAEDGGATTINGDDADNSANIAGAAYVFLRVGLTWSQQAYVKAANAEGGDNFGISIALSATGDTLAVGAWAEDSDGVGPGANAASNGALESGAVYVFARAGTMWSQETYIKASNTNANDMFGIAVALSAAGDRLAVSATGEASGASDVGGDQLDNSLVQSGAVYTFVRVGVVWTQEAYVKASNPDGGDFFGFAIALSSDGMTLAVSAEGEDGASQGVDAPQIEGAGQAGAVYVFTRSGLWSPQAYLKATNTDADDRFGRSLALGANGDMLVVGAVLEDSAATTIDGDASDNTATDSGAAYVYRRNTTTWNVGSYLKATNTGGNDQLGQSVSLTEAGTTIVVGACNEDSATGDPANDAATDSGAIYVFE